MENLLIYALKSAACLAVFYLYFKWLLSRDTFHRINRLALLVGVVLSFVLPLCVITHYQMMPLVPALEVVADESVAATPAAPTFDWIGWIAGAYLLGAGVMFLREVWSIVAVCRMIRRGRKEPLAEGVTLVRSAQISSPCSWGRSIVIPDEAFQPSELTAILAHERAHIRFHHSADLCLFDLVLCLQWFNPAMWLLRRELRAVHEYQADEAVIESGVDARDYQLLLIKKAVGGRWYSVANSFNHSKLKNRITMMLQKRSSRWAGAKTLLLLPLTVLAVEAFAETVTLYPEDKTTKKEPKKEIVIVKNDSVPSGRVVYVENKQVADATLDTLKPDQISTVTVYKNGTTYAEIKGKGNASVLTTHTDSTGTQHLKIALEGKTAGEIQSVEVADVDSLNHSGLNGKVVKIRGRQVEAKDQPEPLYVIDGEVVSSEVLQNLPQNKIAAITVLKDKSAVEKYGEKGANGVVLITTK